MLRVCGCKACKKMARKGMVLGSRNMGYWHNGQFGFGSVSDYVPFPRFAKGKRVRRPGNVDYLKDI